MRKSYLMAVFLFIILTVTISCGTGNTPIEQNHENSGLDCAKTYLIIREANLANENPNRSAGLWLVTSKEADSFEEFAQTAAQAVLDLYHLHHKDFTSVKLIPRDGVEIAYAQANFSADGKGPEGMTGSASAIPSYWKIWAADRVLNQQELEIAELWSAKQQDFPQQNLCSSQIFDVETLRHFIAETLKIPYDEVQMPGLILTEYELPQTFIDETIYQAVSLVPSNL